MSSNQAEVGPCVRSLLDLLGLPVCMVFLDLSLLSPGLVVEFRDGYWTSNAVLTVRNGGGWVA